MVNLGLFFSPKNACFDKSQPLYFLSSTGKISSQIKNIEPKWQSFMARYRKEMVITPKRI
jgi:hypothetical protein